MRTALSSNKAIEAEEEGGVRCELRLERMTASGASTLGLRACQGKEETSRGEVR